MTPPRPSAAPADAPAFLDPRPPPWASRALAWLMLLLAAAAAITLAVVRVTDTVPGRFVLVRGAGGAGIEAELAVPLTGLWRVEPGQPVRLLYDLFPPERHGVASATVREVATPGTLEGVGPDATLRARATLARPTVEVAGRARPLLPGMGGRALVIVGRRPLWRELFGSGAGP